MAPETMAFSFSDKADIWSLGCVLLQMTGCSRVKGRDLLPLLQGLRVDSSRLEEALVATKCREKPVASVLRAMLQGQPSMRPSAEEMLELPFVRESLILAGSPLIKVKKSLPPGLLEIILSGGIQTVLEFMVSYQDIEEAQEKSIERLLSLLKEAKALGKLDPTAELLSCDSILGCLLRSLRRHEDNEALAGSTATLFMMMATNGQYKTSRTCLSLHL
nr:PREDICTED: serine/threonine kinase-like domain-containing protein STKLD1 [Anolis carolinensis]|eukprot:XP_008122882.1 PREDICTED: serine/threonine kinase-like domain-containing protein STKLD1 [Anolis carolinensis]